MIKQQSLLLSIVVCTYNREKYIAECIKHLLNQDIDSYLLELIIINNKSTDSTDAICRKILSETDANIRYFIEENPGLSYARNRGIQESNGSIIAFIDDDAMVEKEFALNLIRYYDRFPQMAASGGKIYPRFEGTQPTWLSPYLMPLMSTLDLGNQPVRFKKNAHPIGANMAFRKEVVTRIGGFATHLGRTGTTMLGGEEKDFFYRLLSAKVGDIYYLPDTVVHHVIPESRLTNLFIKKQGIGIGVSERIRTMNIGKKAYIHRCLLEMYKWGGSLVLWVIYTFKGQTPKGNMIICFRAWVSKGLFFQKNNFKND